MDCAKARAFMCPELDDELPVTGSAMLQDHLTSCSRCSNEWEALLLVHQNIRALQASIVVPEALEERLITVIDSETRKRKVGFSSSARVVFLATLAVAACVSVFMFSSKTLIQDSAEMLVFETADGSKIHSKKNFKRVAGVDSRKLAATAKSIGLDSTPLAIAGLSVATNDVLQDHQGRKILRTCFQDSRDHSFCVDCYQAPSGLLSFKGAELNPHTGRGGQFEHIGNHNVIMLSKNGVDYVYASTLSKDRLLALIFAST